MSLIRYIIISMVAILLGGCVALPISNTTQKSPRVYGTVLDADTGTPLVGVSVIISGYSAGSSLTCATGIDGKYEAVEKQKNKWLIISLLPGDAFGSISVRYDYFGYQSVLEERHFARGSVGRGRYQGVKYHIDVRMKKTEPNQSLQTTIMAITDAAAKPPRQP